MGHDGKVIAWLMEGDPAIRWQVMRDLLDEPERLWQRDRARVAREGWGARLLALQDPEGTWAGGLYTPKWTSTTYTLLLLRDMGLPQECGPAVTGCRLIYGADPRCRDWGREDTCVVGMWLALGAYFGVGRDAWESIVRHLLAEQMPDGGWNCRRRAGAVHSSVHTTINVLEGMREARTRGVAPARTIETAERRAVEFLLMHRMYRSDHTGDVIDPAFTMLSFPPRWHYDVLRGLDFVRRTEAIGDPRLSDAFGLLAAKRRGDGRWPVQNRHPGKAFFGIEGGRAPSRWNTLRALRCIRAREASAGCGNNDVKPTQARAARQRRVAAAAGRRR